MNFLLLCILPAVLAVPLDKRFLFPGFNLGSIFDLETLKCDIQIMLDVVGTDPTEKACEDECHNIIQEGHYLNFGCPLVCHAFQNLAHYFHEVPKPGEQHAHCGVVQALTTTVPALTVLR